MSTAPAEARRAPGLDAAPEQPAHIKLLWAVYDSLPDDKQAEMRRIIERRLAYRRAAMQEGSAR